MTEPATRPNVTTGTIGFGQTVNTGDYNSQRADASFTFLVPEGGSPDDAATIAGDLAKRKVQELLGLAPISTAVEKTTRTRKPKADAPAAVPTTPASDPAAMTEPSTQKSLVEIQAANQAKPKAADPADVGGEEDFTSFPTTRTIPDTELQSACSARAAKLKAGGAAGNDAALKIKKLIEKFCPAGSAPGASQIPQASRVTFLKELEALA